MKYYYLRFALTCFVSLVLVTGFSQTNPTPHQLKTGKYIFAGFATVDTIYPPSMAGWRGPIQTLSPQADVTVQATADEPLCDACTGIDIVSISNESTKGISIRHVMDAVATEGPLAVVLALNTTDCYGVKVIWRGATMVGDPSINDLSAQALSLQYRTGTTGDWTDVNTYTETDFGLGASPSAFIATLPANAENKAVVQLRWIIHTVNNIVPADRILINSIAVEADSIANISPKPGYCDANGDLACSSSVYIDNVEFLFTSAVFPAISNASGCALDSGYSDYTAISTTVTTGEAYNLYAAYTFGPELITPVTGAFYFDWNQDGDFEDSLEVANLSPSANFGNTEMMGLATVPPSAKSGLTRMRVRIVSGGETLSPCGISATGEVEDYSVIVNNTLFPAPACSDTSKFTPRSGSLNVCNSPVFRWPSAVDALGYRFRLLKDDLTVLKDTLVTDTTLLMKGTLTPGASYFWQVSPYNDNGSSICDTLFFQASPNSDPIVSILPSADTVSTCSGVPLALDGGPAQGTVPYTHRWNGTTGNSNLSDTASQTSTFTGTPGIYKYAYTVTDNNGCRATDTVHILVNPNPQLTDPQAADNTLCAGETTTLTLNSSAGSTVSWEDSTATQPWLVTGNVTNSGGNQYALPALSQTVYYRAIATFPSTGCSATSQEVGITVNALPAAPAIIITENAVNCAGTTVILYAPTTDEVAWNDINSTKNDTLLVTSSGTYSATITDVNGCKSNTVPQSVSFAAIPAKPVITMISNTPLCEGDAAVLSSSYATGNLWSNSSTGSTLVVNSNGTFTVTHTDANGCSNTSDPYTVTFGTRPATPSVSQSGNTITSSVSGGSYQWFNQNGPISGATNSSYDPGAAGEYSVVVYSPEGCESDTSAKFYFSGVGINETADSPFNIYPNPANVSFYISGLPAEDVSVTVYNIYGQLVGEENLSASRNLFNASKLTAGSYLVKIGESTRLIVITK